MVFKFNLATTKVKDNKLIIWVGAMSYMATKVFEVFGVAKDNKNQGLGGNSGSISSVKGLVWGRGRRWSDRGQGRDQG